MKVFFSISLVINIIFLFAMFLSRRYEIKRVLLLLSNIHKSCLYFGGFFILKANVLHICYFHTDIIHLFIIGNHRKAILKLKSTTNVDNLSRLSESKTEHTAITVDPYHYQELQVLQPENTYQTLHQQWLLQVKSKSLNEMNVN